MGRVNIHFGCGEAHQCFVAWVPLYVLVAMSALFIILYFLMLLPLKGFSEEDMMIIRTIQRKTRVEFIPIKVLKRFIGDYHWISSYHADMEKILDSSSIFHL